MQIFKNFSDNFFKEKSRILGNCYTICKSEKILHYEIIIEKNKGKIISDTDLYLEDVAQEHHKDHPNISYYYTRNHDFSMSFEKKNTFKLPISILQVSKLFLNKNYIKGLKNYFDPETICVPVKIIEDEYVLLDKHHEVYLAYTYGLKMIEVYLDEPQKDILNPLYLAKEQNIRTIQDIKLLSSDAYESLTTELDNLFQSI